MKPLEHTPDARHSAKECILCGRCLEVCPLFKATQREELSPKAKHLLARALHDDDTALRERAAVDLAALCLSCGRCEKACPQGLCAPDVVSSLRASHPDWEQWLWKTWIEKGGALWPALAALAKVAPRALPGDTATILLRKLKAMSGTTPAPWLRLEASDDSRHCCGLGPHAVLFPGCMADRLRTEWVRKARALLDSLGFEPPAELAGAREPEWSCCGCTLGHAGLKDVQRSMQQANVDAWRAAGRPLVASFCATCRCGLRSYADAPGLGWGEGEAEQWRAAQVPLSSLLQGTTFAVDDAAAPPALYYHTPCHGAGGGHDLEFLRRVAGERLRKWTTDDCCGMGGVMQLGSPALSQRVGDDLWRRLDPEPGGQLVTGCSGCVLQLTATAPEGVSVAHWLDLLDL